MPSYPHPPDPFAPPPHHIRARSAGGRLLATILAHRRAPPAVAPSRILLIRPDHLGDLLFLSPALDWLRTQHPRAHLTLAIGPWARPALPALAGAYDDLLVTPFPAFERGERAGLRQRWSLLPRLARQLRQQRFDAALILRPDHWWGAMLAALAGIPQRLGYDTPETTPWLTTALSLPHEHAAASNLRLASALLGQTAPADPLVLPLHFALDYEDRAAAQALREAYGIASNRPLIIIHPGAGAAVKLWEAAKWGEVAQRLGEAGARVAITGGPGEEALATAVTRAARGGAIDLGGRTSFGALAALLATADLVLGPDSGPLHLAVAVDAPTIHLFGPADPIRFGPWGDPARHVALHSGWTCAPCGRFDWGDLSAHGCVRDIAIAQVMEAAAHLLTRTGASRKAYGN